MGARGSGQSFSGFDGMGPAVDRMAVDVRAWLAKTAAGTQTFGDPYPADSTNDLKPSGEELLLLFTNPIAAAIEYKRDNLDKFSHSIDVGARDAVREADDELVDCPHTSLVMIGYSQGAMAMHQAELQLRAHHPRVFHRIVGTLLLADGDHVPAPALASSAHRWPGPRASVPICTPSPAVTCPFPAARPTSATPAI
jgi:Cutinase